MFGGIPFEHFGSFSGGAGGGMGGMGGGGAPPDTTKLYEALEVDKDATDKEIKKAYRNLSRIHHPDKGGDEAKFKEINAAYEILSDPDKRKKYDQYGLDGVTDETPGHTHDDLFSMFFGGAGGSGRGKPRKGPNVKHPLKVSLEDLYNSRTVKLAVTRKVLVGEPKDCSPCKGRGVKVELRQIGPGMVQQLQSSCPSCNGQGYQCETKNERKVLEVFVEKGMVNGEKITFRNMADEVPKIESGDIIFTVQEKEHDLFKRKGADLLIVKTLSLNQALTGFDWKIKHLDGRTLHIKSQPGEIIQPETEGGQPFVKIIKDEGMPSRGNPFVKGNLYVLFRVEFPSDGELSQEIIDVLRKTLPGSQEMDEDIATDEEAELDVVHLTHADVKNFGKGGARSERDAYDSDEEGNGRQVQCQQS